MAHNLVWQSVNFLVAIGVQRVHLCSIPCREEAPSQKKSRLLTGQGVDIWVPGACVAAGEGLVTGHKAWTAFQVAVVDVSLSSGTHPLTVGDRGKGVTGREAVKVAADTAGAACVHLGAGGEEHAGAAQECVVEVVPGVRLARGGVSADSSTFLLCLHSCHST